MWEHRRGFAIAAAILLMLAFLLNGLSSCSVIMDGVGSGIAASTYPSQDADMLSAEAQYCAMEAELQHYLDTYESTHDYDEYHFDLDTIEHDPYVLISIITALHQGEWTLDEVQGTLQMLFDRQYILTEDVVVETHYRTETDTWTDADGNTHTDTYQVPYDYYICTVTLENFNLSHVPVYIMSEEQLGMYATYMATLGNRPDLFPGSGYIGKYVEGSYTDYDIPPEVLDDEVFAAIIKEAEKYLGYPYVWGGSSPSTSFDCSGFVSWVINHSGWDVGRLGAQGLCNICTPVPSANVKPGDLVFFTGTYDTPGVSHARGNLVRIENALDKMPERLRSVQEQLENLYNQQAAAKAEVGKPFPQEQELAAKTARLIELDMELNLDGKGQPQPEQAIAKSARPSVLDRLKAPPVHGAPEKPHKKEMEAR